jgi:hypothetical protein
MLAATGVGGFILLAAWYGASGAVEPRHQIPWLDAAAGGLIVAAAGMAAFLRLTRQALAERLARLQQGVEDRRPANRIRQPQPAAAFVASGVMTRYHRPGCPLVTGKDVAAGSREAHEDRGRRPCGICQP